MAIRACSVLISATALFIAGSGTGALAAAGPNATFATMTTYTVGNAARDVTVADVNGDGKPDAVTANSIANTVSVLLGNGDGTFNPAYSAGTVFNTRGVAIADFDKDGDRDIVATLGSGVGVVLLSNQGESTPTFAPTTLMTNTGAIGMREVVAADFNADSYPDIAAAGHGSGKVGVLINKGSAGGFKAAVEYTTGSLPTGLASGDVDGDGDRDVVSFNRTGGATATVTVLQNGGSGTFTTTNYYMGPNPDFGALGDLTGDGKPEIIAANTTSTAGVTVGLNNGSGSFTKGTTSALSSGATAAEGASVADLNLDGNLDVVVAVNTTTVFNIFYGNGDGTLAAAVTAATSTGMPYAATTADLNADNKPDVLLTSANSSPNNLLGVVLNTTTVLPGAPTALSALAGDGMAKVSFTPPAEATGITNYQYSINGGSSWTALSPVTTASPVTVTGLTNGTQYQITLRAVTAAGNGAASAAVSVTPSARPSAPRSTGVAAGTVSWTAPAWASAPTAYLVVYKKWADRDNAAVPWGVLASRAKAATATFAPTFTTPTQLQLAMAPKACGVSNQTLGWTNCPLPYGLSSGSYALRVYAMNGSTAGPMAPTVQAVIP